MTAERVWLKQYESHVPSDIEPSEDTLVNIIERSVKAHGDAPAFYYMGKSISFRELDQYSLEMAAYLQQSLGLKKGDRVAIMMPNILQYPVALMGILRAGLTVVNVNPLYTARELEHQLKDSGAKAIFIVSNFAHTLAEVIKKTAVDHVILTELGDMLPFPKSLLVNVVVKYVKKMVPPFDLPGATDFRTALGIGSTKTLQKPSVTADDLAFLQYTGGTTGVSKGAMLTHRNIVANVTQAKTWIGPHTLGSGEVIITPLPLYHIFSLTANCFVYFSMGGLNVLIHNPRDLDEFISIMKKFKFTAITGVNTLFNGLLNHPKFTECDFSSLQVTLGGGMAVQKPVAEKWMAVTGKPLIQAYGLTETSPAAIINPFTIESFTGSIGLPISSTLVSIRNDEGQEVPFGQPGEIWIKGPQVMKGYWQRPDETSQVLTPDGWFKSGDIAVMDEKGWVTIVDRKKDMILVSGFNVYPNEIEEVVASHPLILEAAAVGVSDDKTGEAIKVYCVRKNDTVGAEELVSYCREHLTGYKVPRQFEFREELPKTNVGKILRRALRDDRPSA